MRRKFLSIALTLLMVLSLVPGIGEYSYAAGNNQEPVATLFFASDYQDKNTNPQQQLPKLMDNVVAREGEIDNAVFCGDYTNGSGYNYGDDATSNINIIKNLTATKFGSATETMFLQGNHDKYNSSIMDADGLHEFDNYMVYILNTQSANPWQQGSVNAKNTVISSANTLRSTLGGLTETQKKKPIFIATHVPLHMSSRTSSKYGSGDNMYASYLFNAINEAAQTLDIVVLYGHNHSHGWDSYLGGSSVYKPKGATLPVPDCGGVSSRTDKYTNERLNFTYMNAGYVGYYTENTSPADDTLTCTTIKIYQDNMVVTRYDQSGVHKLGSQGSYNTAADNGIYNDETGFGATNGSYGQSAAYALSSSNISSPQEITRINQGEVVLTPALTLSGAHTSVDIGSMDSVKANLKNGTVNSYSWTTSNESVAKLLDTNQQTVRVEYNKAGSATITCTVNYTGADGNPGTLSKEYGVTVNDNILGGNGLTYTKVTDVNQITAGDGYLIITNAGSKTHLVEKNIVTNARTGLVASQALANAGDNEISGDYSAHEWTLVRSGSSWKLHDKDGSGYITAATSSNCPVSWVTNSGGGTDFTISKTGTDNFNLGYSESYVLQLSTNRNLVYGYDSSADTKDFYIYKKTSGSNSEPAAEILQANGDPIASSYAVGASQSFKTKLTNISQVVSYQWSIEDGSGVASIRSGTEGSAAPVVTFKKEGLATLDAVITYRDGSGNNQTVQVSQILNSSQADVNIVNSSNVIITDVLQRRYQVTSSMTEAVSCQQNLTDTGVEYEWSSSDPSVATVAGNGADATISFTGETGYTYITVKVTGRDSSGNSFAQERGVTYYASKDPKTTGTVDYPAYPDEGAIRLDKTADSVGFSTTGVARVKLQLDGISAAKPKDIVLVADMSSSMKETITGADGTSKKRVDVMSDSILPLIDNILGPNVDGTPSQNRMAIVAFNNYDYHKISSANNVNYSASESADGFNHDTTGRDPKVSSLVGAGSINELKQVTTEQCVEGTCKSGTNYDMGLSEAYKILAEAKGEAGYNRDQVVIFMSDGAPYQYNYFRGYSGNGSAGKGIDWMAWLNGDSTNSTVNNILASNAYGQDYFNEEGQNWWAEAIKATEDSSCKVIDPYDASAAGNNYIKNVNGLGALMYSVGFCLEADGEVTLEQTHQTLDKIATSQDTSLHADNAADLDEAFDVITRQLNFAASDAVVTDTIGESYSLQVASSVTVGEQTHDLTSPQYIGEDPYIMVYTQKLDPQRRPTDERIPVEKITFNVGANGQLLGAKSTAVADPTANILSGGQINGKYITYNVATKTFTCNIGNVQGDRKYELEYFVSLDGAGAGSAAAGSYATNQAAIATYTNYQGNTCTMDFPVPYMPWKAANVTYEFYMVNENGQPINAAGAVVPIDQRETLYLENQTIPLNSQEIAEASVIASNFLREGYELYSPDTSYYLKAASGTNVSVAYINDNQNKQTTLVYRPSQATYDSGSYQIAGGTYNYKVNVDDYGNTHVLFAVKQKPDTISKSVHKVWSDNNNSEGKRPEAITVELQVSDPTSENPENMETVPGSQVRLSEVNGWQHTWKNLTKYKYENGSPTNQEIEYQVIETTTLEDYVPTYETDNEGNVTVTNTYKGSYSLKITKENSEHTALQGAGFKLYQDEACTQLANVYTDDTLQHMLSDASDSSLWTDNRGQIYFYGLDDGNYWIKEFRTPSGYTLLNQPVKLTVVGEQVSVTVNGETYPATVYEKVINLTITNQKLDTSIPFTAGMGKYGLLIVSIALMCLVLWLLRRREAKLPDRSH